MRIFSILTAFVCMITLTSKAQYCWKTSAYESDYQTLTPVSRIISNTWMFDINQDGRKDIVETTGSYKLYLDIKQANGTYQVSDSLDIHTGNYFTGPVFGDVNQDGLLDISINDDFTIVIYGTDNAGHFTQLNDTIVTPDPIRALSLTDRNGDNFKELIVGIDNSSFQNVYQFQSPGVYSVTTGFYCTSNELFWIDMNLDGDEELFDWQGYQGPLAGLFLYDEYTPDTLTYTNPISITYYTNIIAADVDLDGLPDAIATDFDSVHIYKNPGNLQLHYQQGVKVKPSVSPYTNNCWLEDMDGDHFPELIVYGNDYLSLYKNNAGTISSTPYCWFSLNSLVIGFDDVNHDGKKDILLNTFSTPSPLGLIALLQDENGKFVGDNTMDDYTYNSFSERILKVVDVNNDGRKDVLVYSEKGLKAFGNNGDRTWNYFGSYPLNFSLLSGYMNDFIVADFNQDGKMDAITPNCFDNKIYYLYGLGASADSVKGVPENNAKYVAEGDFNNDSYMDFAIGIFSPSGSGTVPNIFIKLNDGQGHFTTAYPFPTGISANFNEFGQMDVSDFDNDGDKDIFYQGNSGIQLVKCTGGTNFNAPIVISNASGTGHFKLEDLNNDGFKDLIVDQFSNNVKVYLGSSTGFTPVANPVSGGTANNCIHVADLDEDGLLDFVTHTYVPDTYTIFHGNGNGTFTKFIDLTFEDPSSTLLSGNFDSDNHIDLLGYNNNKSRVYFYYNDSLTLKASSINLCGGKELKLNVDSSSNWTWYNNSNSIAFNQNPYYAQTSGNYFAQLTTNYGCVLHSDTLSILVSACDSVYPGDANMDGNCDGSDLLRLGLLYGDTGTARAITGNNWQGYFATNWGTTFQNLDKKFADCNGDGAINLDDTLAISLNYGNTHAKFSNQLLKSSAVENPIYIVTTPGIYHPADTVHAEVYLGSNANPAKNVYGLDLTFQVSNPSVIEANSLVCKFGNTWIGNEDVTYTALAKANGTALSASLTGINHLNRKGYGKIAELSFVLSSTLNIDSVYLGFSAITLLDSSGQAQPVAPQISLLLLDNSTAANSNELNSQEITAYPNPCSNNFTLRYELKKTSSMTVSIVNSLGVEVERYEKENELKGVHSKQFHFSEPGIYFIHIKNGDTQITKKMVSK